MRLSSGSLSAVVYQISSKSDDFSLRCGDVSIFKMAAVRHLGMFYHHTRPPTKSLLLAVAACRISCQSDTQIWRYSNLNFFAYLAWNAYSCPKMGIWGGDFGPINVIIHHPCVNSRVLIYQQCKNPLRGLTCRRVDRKCDGHTYTDTSKFIFCPCIALDRQ